MKYHLKYILPGLISSILLLGGCSSKDTGVKKSEGQNRPALAFTDSLAFISAEGDTVATIAVAIADEPDERARGLMYVTELGQDQGMLFIFQKEQPLSFWMANTPLSLDIIFVNANKEIVRIHHSTPPFSHENFKSGEPALYAIETNAGFTIAHDIRVGMEIRF